MRNRAIERLGGLIAMGLGAMLLPIHALAQKDAASGYPSRAIRVVIPFAPGGVLDIVARLVTPKLNEAWGVPVLVDNRPGATGTIGMDMVAKSQADGHTVGMLIISHSVNSALAGAKMPYDIVRDLTPITQLASNVYVLSVNAKLPVRNVGELVTYARANPGGIRFGSSGTGGVIHLAGEWLALLAKANMTHVPYKGNAQAMTDVAGGHIEMMFSSVSTVMGPASQGLVRMLAVTSPRRLAPLPDVPTLQESGFPTYEVDGWYGIAGPKGIPDAIVGKLNQEMVKAIRLPETRDKLAADGMLAVGSSPAEFAALIRSDNEKWRRVAQERKLTLN
jgi:tripartite-type tricarboxylate transporter receptor subunit TctC